MKKQQQQQHNPASSEEDDDGEEEALPSLPSISGRQDDTDEVRARDRPLNGE
jgi:hypothetical protein